MNRFLCLSIGLALAAGCGSGYGSQSELVGPAGGIVEVQGGATVVVPPGALAHEVTIVVEEGGSPTNVDYVASSLWHFGPDGLAFIKPVVVTIPVTSGMGRNDLAMFWSRPGSSDEYEVVYPAAFSENRDSVTVQINHFSSGFVGTGNANACSTRYKNTGASVEDAWTGLSWFRQDVFLGPTYLEAVNACAESTVDGYTDWRLPTVQEFMEYVRGCGEHNKFGTYWCCLPHEFDECRDKHEWWTSTPGDATDERLLVTFSECPWSTYSHAVGNELSIISAGSDFTCVRGESSVCIPDCSGRECGPDPVCGVPCGTCGGSATCEDGDCVNDTVCEPDCSGRECGFDPVCGEELCGRGRCDEGFSCQCGKCVEDTFSGDWKPDKYTINCGSDGMCYAPAGSFWMGCNNAVDDCGFEYSERPYHQVWLSAYYIDRTEVTQAAYKKCVDAGACSAPSCGSIFSNHWDPVGTPNRPVVCVEWDQAKTYCEWAGKRLPTEAEWENAARGTDGRKYPWGNEDATCEYAVMDEMDNGAWGCGTSSIWDVCSKSPAGDSPYGLCDMAGNVNEWVWDWRNDGGDEYYCDTPSSNPSGPDSGDYRVRRGGDYRAGGYDLRTSGRFDSHNKGATDWRGFRCARDAQ